MKKVKIPYANRMFIALCVIAIIILSIMIISKTGNEIGQEVFTEKEDVNSERIEIFIDNNQLEFIQELDGIEYYADVKYVYKDSSQNILAATKVSWASSDNMIIEVKENGAIVPKAEGIAIISAEYNGLHDTKEVVVKQVKIKKIDIIETSNNPFQYSVVAETPDGRRVDITENQDIQWTISDSSLISIYSGKIHIKGTNEDIDKNVKITATFKGISVDMDIKVKDKIIDTSKIRLNKGKVLIEDINGVVPVHAIEELPDGGTRDISSIVTWTSENTGVVDVYQGIIYANNEGMTVVNAVYMDYHKSIEVIVKQAEQKEQVVHPLP
ncbi:MAG: hypothetical protein FIA99_18495 [Ruminiclostridium sp.]|nr:hypothetical protein [Ruminiclostridium sp.]